MTFPHPVCCCQNCSVAFITLLDEASDESEAAALYDQYRCLLDEHVFHPRLSTAQTGLREGIRSGLELFIDLDFGEPDGEWPYPNPADPQVCAGHELPPIREQIPGTGVVKTGSVKRSGLTMHSM